jgi:general secretion pathway protein A
VIDLYGRSRDSDWPRAHGLIHDPFREGTSGFIPLPSREALIRRALQAIHDREAVVELRGEAGQGKSVVLREVAARLPSRCLRVVSLSCPANLSVLVVTLAARLGVVPHGPNDAWRTLARGIRVRLGLGEHIVLLIDDGQRLDEDDWGRLDPIEPVGHVTLVRAVREVGVREGRYEALSWRVPPLSYSESGEYLRSKLKDTGHGSLMFGPEALGRIHAWSEGVPRAINRLAAAALKVGAERGDLEVGPDLIDEVAVEELDIAW